MTASNPPAAEKADRRFFLLLHDLLDNRLAELSNSEARVVLALLNWIDHRGVCWPSVATIARVAGRNEGNVRRALHSLKARGLILECAQQGGVTRRQLRPGVRLVPDPPRKRTGSPRASAPQNGLLNGSVVSHTNSGSLSKNFDSDNSEGVGARAFVDVDNRSDESSKTRQKLKALGISAWRTLGDEVRGLTAEIVESHVGLAREKAAVNGANPRGVLVELLRDRKWLPADELRQFEARRDFKNAVIREIGIPRSWFGDVSDVAARKCSDDRVTVAALRAELLALPERVTVDANGQIVPVRAAESAAPPSEPCEKPPEKQTENQLSALAAATSAPFGSDDIPF